MQTVRTGEHLAQGAQSPSPMPSCKLAQGLCGLSSRGTQRPASLPVSHRPSSLQRGSAQAQARGARPKAPGQNWPGLQGSGRVKGTCMAPPQGSLHPAPEVLHACAAPACHIAWRSHDARASGGGRDSPCGRGSRAELSAWLTSDRQRRALERSGATAAAPPPLHLPCPAWVSASGSSWRSRCLPRCKG